MSPTMEMVGIRPENKNYLVGTRHLLPVQSRLVLQLVQAMVDSTRDTVFMPQVGTNFPSLGKKTVQHL